MDKLTPELEELAREFPGWTTVLSFAAVYLAAALVVYLVLLVVLRRDGRRRMAAHAAGLAVPGGPPGEAALDAHRRYLERLHRAILRTARILLGVIGLVLLVADLFPSLDVLSSSVGALLVTAGTLGLAGALQPYVRDAVGGVLLMTDDHYGAGDWVRVGGVEGVVEAVHLRRTVVRSADGALHAVPNGSIGIATNMSRAWARTTVELLLAHDVDLERAIAVADAAAAEMAAEPAWAERLVATPRVDRVSDVSAAGVTIRITGRTTAGQAGPVAGELRRRIRGAFLAAGVPLARLVFPAAEAVEAAGPGGPRP